MAGILIGYGIVLAGLGLILQQIAPVFGRVAFIAGLAGGGVSLLWGLAALMGMKGRTGAILTGIATIVVLLIRAVDGWTAASEVVGGMMVRLVLTLMFLLTMGMLMYLLHGERPPEFYERDGATSRAGGKR